MARSTGKVWATARPGIAGAEKEDPRGKRKPRGRPLVGALPARSAADVLANRQ